MHPHLNISLALKDVEKGLSSLINFPDGEFRKYGLEVAYMMEEDPENRSKYTTTILSNSFLLCIIFVVLDTSILCKYNVN